MPPETKRPLKVFLSYASQDRSAVRELYERLKKENWIEPWLDQENLTFGQHWTTVIEEALEEADAVLVFLSNNSVQKEGFIQRELNYAWEISLEKPRSVIFLIPLRLDECIVPRYLRARHWGDYFGEKKENTYQTLLRSLKSRHQQKLSLESAERVRAEKSVRKQAERTKQEAADKAALEKSKQEAKEKVAREKAEKEAAEKARQDVALDEAVQEFNQKNKEGNPEGLTSRKAVESAKKKLNERDKEKESAEKAIRMIRANADRYQVAEAKKRASERATRERLKNESKDVSTQVEFVDFFVRIWYSFIGGAAVTFGIVFFFSSISSNDPYGFSAFVAAIANIIIFDKLIFSYRSLSYRYQTAFLTLSGTLVPGNLLWIFDKQAVFWWFFTVVAFITLEFFITRFMIKRKTGHKNITPQAIQKLSTYEEKKIYVTAIAYSFAITTTIILILANF